MASSEYNKAYYQKNKERLKEAARKYYHEHKEQHRARSRAWYYANKEKSKARNKLWWEEKGWTRAEKDKILARRTTLRQYGLTEEGYAEIVAAQNGVCAICQRPCDVADNLSVDHCHRTNRVRGLLCRRCNSGLGFFRENATLLLKAAAYLDEQDTKPEAA